MGGVGVGGGGGGAWLRYHVWPWMLCNLVDDRIEESALESVLDAFMSACPFCFDEGMGYEIPLGRPWGRGECATRKARPNDCWSNFELPGEVFGAGGGPEMGP